MPRRQSSGGTGQVSGSGTSHSTGQRPAHSVPKFRPQSSGGTAKFVVARKSAAEFLMNKAFEKAMLRTRKILLWIMIRPLSAAG
jgi:hypothetical protein